MSRWPIMLLLAAVSLTVRGACDGDGIGGTGAPVAQGGDGIGGTGAPVRLALVGTIKAFGSICVNGVKVEYDDQTPVARDAGVAAPRDLALGQVVEVEAERMGDQYHARGIRIVTALEGPVTRALPQGGLQVLGRSVELAADAHVQGPGRLGLAAAADFAPGQRVRVSGFARADGVLQATRLEPAPAGPDRRQPEKVRVFERQQDRVSIEGYVLDDRLDVLRVGDQEIALAPGLRIDGGTRDDVKVNRHVIIEGSWKAGGRLEGDRIRLDRIETRGSADPAEPERRTRDGKEGSDDRAGNAGQTRAERAERPERAERAERAERPERAERADRVDRAERPERAERAERAERPERAERVDRADRAERAERPERSER